MSVMIAILTVALIILSAAAIVVMIKRVILMRRFPLLILLFLILPVGQLFILYSLRLGTWSFYWLAGVLLSLLADVLLLIYAILQEKKTIAIEELKEVQHRMALEKSHFDAVQSRREQLAEIRRNFTDQLEAAAKLADDGNDDSAKEQIAVLADQIKQTQESPYCTIPVVNAILAEKEKTCEAAGIELSVDLDVPDPLAVSPMHLCSIFSNILDNAITACQKLQSADKPLIRLSSRTNGDYLFIKATNPSDIPNQTPVPGRGFGLRILSELAKRYNGDFQSNYRNGIFTAVVSLLATDSLTEG